MVERKNTLLCVFDVAGPRISALDVHTWVFESLKVGEADICMIQLDGTRKQVYIKFNEQEDVLKLLRETGGAVEYKHQNGEISVVKLELAGLGTRRVRVANLPPELPHSIIRTAVEQYGVVQSITDEIWANHYRYKVATGARIVTMVLSKHLPSHLNMAGQRALITYEGQPQTCYGCGEMYHLYMECPKRRSLIRNRGTTTGPAWSRPEEGDKGQKEAERGLGSEENTNNNVMGGNEGSVEGLGKEDREKRVEVLTEVASQEKDEGEVMQGGVGEASTSDRSRSWNEEMAEETASAKMQGQTGEKLEVEASEWPQLVLKERQRWNKADSPPGKGGGGSIVGE